MKLRRQIFILMCFMMTAPVVFAQKKPNQPRRGETIVIMKLVMNPKVDYRFFYKYKKILDAYFYLSAKEKEDRSETFRGVFYTGSTLSDFEDFYGEYERLGEDGEFFGVNTEVTRGNKIYLAHMIYSPAEYTRIMFSRLPLNHFAAVPKGSRFVYCGTIVFNWTGYQLDIRNVKIIDEFEEARQYVEDNWGPEAAEELIRVPLQERTDEE